jgi:hypothetical protein
MNEKQRNAKVALATLAAQKYKLGSPEGVITFRRYLSAGEKHLHADMQAQLGQEYADALVEGDPEIDMELVGRTVARTDQVYLSASGEVLYSPPRIIELILAPDGSEKERREPQDVEGNVDVEAPVRWTGRKVPKDQAVRQFVFTRTLQLTHVDGLTFDFMYDMAKTLAEEKVMVLLGAGSSGKEPLVMQTNGTPYRGFLEGRVEGERYLLLLHLSNMELKRPAAPEKAAKK